MELAYPTVCDIYVSMLLVCVNYGVVNNRIAGPTLQGVSARLVTPYVG